MLKTFKVNEKQKKRLPLVIELVGYHHLQEPVVRNKGMPLFQWICCEEGCGEFVLNNRRIRLSPGQIILTYPNEAHSYRAVTEEWYVHIIGFSGSCRHQLMQVLRMQESGIYHFKNPDIFHVYFEKIMAEDDPSPGTLSKLCYDFLLDLRSI